MLNYQAHVAGGHYAIESVPANTTLRVDLLASSYNGNTVKAGRVFIGNAGNSGNVAIKIAGVIASMTPPYSNDTVDVAGLSVIEIQNSGSIAINVMFADEKMKNIAAGVFASLAISAQTSDNQLVNNFEVSALSSLENEGTASGVIYTAPAGTKLTGISKFGERAISSTIATLDDSGLLIEATQLFDMSQDFTLDGWFTYGGGNQVLFRIGAEQASLNNSITYWLTTATAMNVNAFGSAALNGGATFASTTYNHVALSKIGTTLRFFVNGTENGGVGRTITSTAKLDKLGVMYSGLNNATYRCGLGKADAVRYLAGIGLWDSNFTAPTTPPV